MPEMIFPEREELKYRRKLLADEGTMEYAGGSVDFPESQWDKWLEGWKDADPSEKYYALIFCDGCGYFVGENSYRKTADRTAELSLLIEKDLRNEGYGGWALKTIGAEAEKNGIDELMIRIRRNHPDKRFFKKRGFRVVSREGQDIVMKADTSELASGRVRSIARCCHKMKDKKEDVQEC